MASSQGTPTTTLASALAPCTNAALDLLRARVIGSPNFVARNLLLPPFAFVVSSNTPLSADLLSLDDLVRSVKWGVAREEAQMSSPSSTSICSAPFGSLRNFSAAASVQAAGVAAHHFTRGSLGVPLASGGAGNSAGCDLMYSVLVLVRPAVVAALPGMPSGADLQQQQQQQPEPAAVVYMAVDTDTLTQSLNAALAQRLQRARRQPHVQAAAHAVAHAQAQARAASARFESVQAARGLGLLPAVLGGAVGFAMPQFQSPAHLLQHTMPPASSPISFPLAARPTVSGWSMSTDSSPTPTSAAVVSVQYLLCCHGFHDGEGAAEAGASAAGSQSSPSFSPPPSIDASLRCVQLSTLLMVAPDEDEDEAEDEDEVGGRPFASAGRQSHSRHYPAPDTGRYLAARSMGLSGSSPLVETLQSQLLHIMRQASSSSPTTAASEAIPASSSGCGTSSPPLSTAKLSAGPAEGGGAHGACIGMLPACALSALVSRCPRAASLDAWVRLADTLPPQPLLAAVQFDLPALLPAAAAQFDDHSYTPAPAVRPPNAVLMLRCRQAIARCVQLLSQQSRVPLSAVVSHAVAAHMALPAGAGAGGGGAAVSGRVGEGPALPPYVSAAAAVAANRSGAAAAAAIALAASSGLNLSAAASSSPAPTTGALATVHLPSASSSATVHLPSVLLPSRPMPPWNAAAHAVAAMNRAQSSFEASASVEDDGAGALVAAVSASVFGVGTAARTAHRPAGLQLQQQQQQQLLRGRTTALWRVDLPAATAPLQPLPGSSSRKHRPPLLVLAAGRGWRVLRCLMSCVPAAPAQDAALGRARAHIAAGSASVAAAGRYLQQPHVQRHQPPHSQAQQARQRPVSISAATPGAGAPSHSIAAGASDSAAGWSSGDGAAVAGEGASAAGPGPGPAPTHSRFGRRIAIRRPRSSSPRQAGARQLANAQGEEGVASGFVEEEGDGGNRAAVAADDSESESAPPPPARRGPGRPRGSSSSGRGAVARVAAGSTGRGRGRPRGSGRGVRPKGLQRDDGDDLVRADASYDDDVDETEDDVGDAWGEGEEAEGARWRGRGRAQPVSRSAAAAAIYPGDGVWDDDAAVTDEDPEPRSESVRARSGTRIRGGGGGCGGGRGRGPYRYARDDTSDEDATASSIDDDRNARRVHDGAADPAPSDKRRRFSGDRERDNSGGDGDEEGSGADGTTEEEVEVAASEEGSNAGNERASGRCQGRSKRPRLLPRNAAEAGAAADWHDGSESSRDNYSGWPQQRHPHGGLAQEGETEPRNTSTSCTALSVVFSEPPVQKSPHHGGAPDSAAISSPQSTLCPRIAASSGDDAKSAVMSSPAAAAAKAAEENDAARGMLLLLMGSAGRRESDPCYSGLVASSPDQKPSSQLRSAAAAVTVSTSVESQALPAPTGTVGPAQRIMMPAAAVGGPLPQPLGGPISAAAASSSASPSVAAIIAQAAATAAATGAGVIPQRRAPRPQYYAPPQPMRPLTLLQQQQQGGQRGANELRLQQPHQQMLHLQQMQQQLQRQMWLQQQQQASVQARQQAQQHQLVQVRARAELQRTLQVAAQMHAASQVTAAAAAAAASAAGSSAASAGAAGGARAQPVLAAPAAAVGVPADAPRVE